MDVMALFAPEGAPSSEPVGAALAAMRVQPAPSIFAAEAALTVGS
jgi:hypothetical protein